MTRLIVCLTGLIYLLNIGTVASQDANNPLLYSYQAVEFGDQQVSHDPVTLVMPGTAMATGFGSYLDNPASAALFRDSFGSFGLAFRNVNEDALFLGNRNSFDDNQAGISNLGFIYRFPTVQGSFVIGAGYTQHSFYNRALTISGRNENTSITDNFKIPGNTYQDIAFNAYATDYGDEFEDWDESILRIGFPQYGDYLGMDQEAEILQRGFGGEYSAFFATEFMKNLMVGASVGIKSGRFSYERTFLEIDRPNFYNGAIIDSNEDGEGDTDIDSILLNDEVRSEYLSFTARVGAIYRVNGILNVGVSYTFPSRLTVEEEFDAEIISTFNNGDSFADDMLGEFSYNVRSPARINIGTAITNIGPVSASMSAEYVDYSKTRLDFESELFEEERDENNFISNTYTDVWNLRGGIAFNVSEDFIIRGGAGYQPSRFSELDFNKRSVSVGTGFSVGRDARLELGARYTTWDEEATVYEYGDYDYSFLPEEPPAVTTRSEIASHDVSRLQILATLRVRFN